MKPVNLFFSIAVIQAVLVLQGCSSMLNPVGDSRFDCNRKQDPKSPYCRSFKAVEAGTATDLPKSRFDMEFSLSDSDRRTGVAPDDISQAALPPALKPTHTNAILPHQLGYGKPPPGAPVREGPVIQRVWVKRFVDDRDLLTENTIVYKEIRGTRWSGFDSAGQIGNGTPGAFPHRVIAPSAAPLQSKEADKAADTAEFKQPGDSTTGLDDDPITPSSAALSMPQ